MKICCCGLIQSYLIPSDGGFIFIDSGTAAEKKIDFISSKSVTFVANAFIHAKRLAQRGFKVLILSGEIKASA